jgi:hypothetical protein
MIEKVGTITLHEIVEVVPQGIVLGRHIELMQVRLECLPDALGALASLVGLDTGEAAAQNSPCRIEHPDNESHRGQAGGQ